MVKNKVYIMFARQFLIKVMKLLFFVLIGFLSRNLFDYLMLIITALTGMGGLLLQGLETSKDFAISKGDEVGRKTAEEQIKGVQMFLDLVFQPLPPLLPTSCPAATCLDSLQVVTL